MADQLLELNEATIHCMLQKFAEEIVDLQKGVRSAKSKEEADELRLAIDQSRELEDELRAVQEFFSDAQHRNRRFTDKEIESLNFFGFEVPKDRMAPPPQSRIEFLPGTSTRELSEAPETETDLADIQLLLRSRMPSEREKTPQSTSDAVETAMHAALSTQNKSQSTSVITGIDSRLHGARFTSEDVDRIVQQTREIMFREFAVEKREIELHMETRIIDLQREQLARQEVWAKEKESIRAEYERDLAEKLRLVDGKHRVELEHLIDRSERTLSKQEADLRELREELLRERTKATCCREEAAIFKKKFEEKSAELERLWDESEANRRNAEQDSKKELAEALKATLATEIRRLGEKNSALESKLREQQLGYTKSIERLRKLAPSTRTPCSEVAHALDTIDAVREHSAVLYTLGSCADVDATDEAVVDTLNALGFPFLISMRRLGRGDYYLDRRVHVRLINGHVMVKPRPPLGSNVVTQYELLTKYLIHLYSPVLDIDEPVDASSAPDARREARCPSADTPERKLRALQQQQRALQQSLQQQQDILLRHQQSIAAALSPSPEANRSCGWRQPPSPSPQPILHPEVRPIDRAEHDDASMTRQKPQTCRREPEAADHPNATHPHLAHHVDLSQLSSAELLQLKKAALAQQVRDMRTRYPAPKPFRYSR